MAPAQAPAPAPHRPRPGVPGASRPADVALLADLVAAALDAGSPPRVALEAAGDAVGGPLGAVAAQVAGRLRLGSDWPGAWAGAPELLAPVRRGLQLAVDGGAPAADLLRGGADEVRRREARSAQVAAQQLGVRLVLPLGLCALPAFLAVGVVPVLLSIGGQVLAEVP